MNNRKLSHDELWAAWALTQGLDANGDVAYHYAKAGWDAALRNVAALAASGTEPCEHGETKAHCVPTAFIDKVLACHGPGPAPAPQPDTVPHPETCGDVVCERKGCPYKKNPCFPPMTDFDALVLTEFNPGPYEGEDLRTIEFGRKCFESALRSTSPQHDAVCEKCGTTNIGPEMRLCRLCAVALIDAARSSSVSRDAIAQAIADANGGDWANRPNAFLGDADAVIALLNGETK